MPAAFGVQALEDIAAAEPVGARAGRARAQAARPRPRRGRRAAGRALSEPDDDVTARDRLPPRRPDRAGLPDAARRRACRSPTPSRTCWRATRSTARCSGSRSSGSRPGPELLDEVAERAGVAPAGATGELADAVGRLEAVAHTDDLTGLHNRRSWLDTVRRELDAGAEGTLLICDIDGFKAVNEAHGHRAGDLVLAEVARVLARHGVAGRLGGDEFGVWVWGAEAPARPPPRSSRTSSTRSRSSWSRATRRWASRSAPRRAAAT